MMEKCNRQIAFENVPNFRDLGGLKARGGKTVARRRIYRSAELAKMTQNDFDRLTGEIGLTSVIDLRSAVERERQGIGLLAGTGVKFHNVSFLAESADPRDSEKRFTEFPGMGEFYVYLITQKRFGARIVDALEIIAEKDNHPLVFHCAVGKDRTGLLAALLLSALGVGDRDIIKDYALSAPHMIAIRERTMSSPKTPESTRHIPDFFWGAVPESMDLLLNTLKQEYGSIEGYLKENGADATLIERLEKALLV